MSKQQQTNCKIASLILVFLFILFILFRVPSQELRNLSYIATLFAVFVGIASLALSFFSNNKKNKNDKKQLINSIDKQLDVISYWTSEKKGGYSEEKKEKWIKDNFIKRGNPFYSVNEIEVHPLNTINLLPGYIHLDSKIRKAIVMLNQEITTFNWLLEDIRAFKYSRDANDNVLLNKKLRENNVKNLTKEEKAFMEKLVRMYAVLHFDIIGDSNEERLHYWHSELKSLLMGLKKELEIE